MLHKTFMCIIHLLFDGQFDPQFLISLRCIYLTQSLQSKDLIVFGVMKPIIVTCTILAFYNAIQDLVVVHLQLYFYQSYLFGIIYFGYFMKGAQWQYERSDRLVGLDQPRVWSVLTPLSFQLKASNLGQGFPTWSPPDFYLKALKQQVDHGFCLINVGSHQYVRSYGSVRLVEAIAKFHQPNFPEKIDPLNDIVTTNGGSQALFCCFMGILNPGEEVIFFDPAYDCYRSQIQMAGGKSIGLPLKPRYSQTKEQLRQKIKQNGDKIIGGEHDTWDINFEEFEKAITEKTKIVLINSPHNPVGKVFTQEELSKISKIIEKYPKIVIVEDNVYEGMTFDEYLGKKLPKIIYEPGMYERTVSVYSGGKIFAATGMRSGWAIGSKRIIQSVRSVHQYTVFCYYNVIENALAKSIQTISSEGNTYLIDYATKCDKLRTLVIEALLNSKYDIDLWVPKGSNFVIVDISRCKVDQKYMVDDKGNKRTRDYAFALQLIYEDGVSVIPCSPFYDENNLQDREKYIRVTFCKDSQIIKQAGSKMCLK